MPRDPDRGLTDDNWSLGATSGATSRSRHGSAVVRILIVAGVLSVALVVPALAKADRTPPTAPGSLTATALSASAIRLNWLKSTDNAGVTSYLVYRGSTRIATVGGTTLTYTNTALSASTAYSYTVRAKDAAGNISASSNVVSATTQAAADTVAPSVPTNVTAVATSKSAVTVSWSASTDNAGGSGVASYAIYRDGVLSGTVAASATSYGETGLTPSTTYSYSVRAKDAAGNVSAESAPATATTPGVPPVNSSPPVVSGTPTVGEVLSTTDGQWSGSPTSFAYQWQRCDSSGLTCTDIDGATNASYTLAQPDQGTTIRSVVTASNEVGSDSSPSIATSPVAAQAPTTAAYYVDCAGSDAADGLSPETAWRTFAKADQASLSPGDSLLLKRDCSWNEQLTANWNGTSSQPIAIGAYGTGDAPRIQRDANGTAKNLTDVTVSGSYQTIQDIATSVINPYVDPNCLQADGTPVPHGWYVGVAMTASSSHNTLQNLDASSLSAGVSMADATNHNTIRNSWFHDLHDLWALQKDAGGAIGSIGIVLHGDDNEISGNVAERNGATCTYADGTISRYSAPFEVFNANRNYVHHNRAYGHRKNFEMGHDSTSTTDDNVLAFNLFVSDVAGAVGPNIHPTGNAYGPVNRTQIYNNTIVLTGANSQALVCGCSGGATVRNNIFVAEGKAAFYSGTITESNNLYWDLQRTTDASADPWVQFNSASQTSLDATSRSVDPSFVDAAKDWHLQANSPAVDGGASIQTPDARITSFLGNDLDGNAWSGDIGAYSYP